MVWALVLLPPGMSPLKILGLNIPVSNGSVPLIAPKIDPFKNFKPMMSRKDKDDECYNNLKYQNKGGKDKEKEKEKEKEKAKEREKEMEMTVMRDIPYEEWSAFINQSPSGMSGEAEGERSYWLCQLSLDRITILLSDTITISHPKSLSTMKSSDAIHAAMREPLARLTSTSYGAYFNCLTPVLFLF